MGFLYFQRAIIVLSFHKGLLGPTAAVASKKKNKLSLQTLLYVSFNSRIRRTASYRMAQYSRRFAFVLVDACERDDDDDKLPAMKSRKSWLDFF